MHVRVHVRVHVHVQCMCVCMCVCVCMCTCMCMPMHIVHPLEYLVGEAAEGAQRAQQPMEHQLCDRGGARLDRLVRIAMVRVAMVSTYYGSTYCGSTYYGEAACLNQGSSRRDAVLRRSTCDSK